MWAKDNTIQNTKIRQDFIDRYGVFSAQEINTKYAFNKTSPVNIVDEWERDGRIFTVTLNDKKLFPAIQFNNHGIPIPEIKLILDTAADKVVGWELAIWLVTPNGWLGGSKPLDLLNDNLPDVLSALEDEISPAIY